MIIIIIDYDVDDNRFDQQLKTYNNNKLSQFIVTLWRTRSATAIFNSDETTTTNYSQFKRRISIYLFAIEKDLCCVVFSQFLKYKITVTYLNN